MAGIIGKKIGMSQFFNKDGKSIPCTMIEAGPCIVTQLKDLDNDGYDAVQLGFDDKKSSKAIKSVEGHVKLSNTSVKKIPLKLPSTISPICKYKTFSNG